MGRSARATPPRPPRAARPARRPALAKSDASGLKVGIAYDIGGRGDQSFNDAAAAGLERAISELGLVKDNTRELSASPNESEDAAATRLRQLVSDGFNPIVAVGFKYATATQTVAAENPQVKFAIVDDNTVNLPNVTPLVFAEEQGSFLVGAAAALKTTACKIGFVGGVETPLIQKFEAGYEAGAKAVAPNIQIDAKYLTPAGDFTGFNDPAKAHGGGARPARRRRGHRLPRLRRVREGRVRGRLRGEHRPGPEVGDRRRLGPGEDGDAADQRADPHLDAQAGGRGGVRLHQRLRGG